MRVDGIITWGGDDAGRAAAPDGQFAAVSAGSWSSCGLRVDGTIDCCGNNDHDKADAPSGQFSAVSAGWAHSCGLRADNTAICWDHNGGGEADGPDGHYSAVSASRGHSCAVRTDGTRLLGWLDLPHRRVGELTARHNQLPRSSPSSVKKLSAGFRAVSSREIRDTPSQVPLTFARLSLGHYDRGWWPLIPDPAESSPRCPLLHRLVA